MFFKVFPKPTGTKMVRNIIDQLLLVIYINNEAESPKNRFGISNVPTQEASPLPKTQNKNVPLVSTGNSIPFSSPATSPRASIVHMPINFGAAYC